MITTGKWAVVLRFAQSASCIWLRAVVPLHKYHLLSESSCTEAFPFPVLCSDKPLSVMFVLWENAPTFQGLPGGVSGPWPRELPAVAGGEFRAALELRGRSPELLEPEKGPFHLFFLSLIKRGPEKWWLKIIKLGGEFGPLSCINTGMLPSMPSSTLSSHHLFFLLIRT